MIQGHNEFRLFVLDPNAAVPGVGTRRYNVTNDNILVPVGGGGFYIPVADSGNEQEATGVNTNKLKFIFKRDEANDRSPLTPRPFIESEWILADCIEGVNITRKDAAPAVNNLLLVGGTGSNQIPVASDWTYHLQVTYNGDRTDLYHNIYNNPTRSTFYTSPDWTTTTFTADQQRDITIQSIVRGINQTSPGRYAAFCIAPSGSGVGGTTVAAAAALAIGSSIIIGYTAAGQAVRLVINDSIREALQALAAAVPGTAEIQPYLLPGTSPVPAGVTVAGTIVGPHVTQFAVVSLDEPKALYDYRMATKVDINVGLVRGFNTVVPQVIADANEGSGTQHQMQVLVRNNQYDQHAGPREYMSYHVAYPTSYRQDATYDLFFIESCANRRATSGLPAPLNFVFCIAVVSFEDPNTPYFTGAANPQKTYIRNILNAFNTNNGLGNPAV